MLLFYSLGLLCDSPSACAKFLSLSISARYLVIFFRAFPGLGHPGGYK
jgi:hypothetical protein